MVRFRGTAHIHVPSQTNKTNNTYKTMKHIILNILAIIGLTGVAAHAQEDGSPLPFAVTLGGKAAAHKKGEAFAKVADAVAADAAIEVAAKAELIIINVAKAGADGNPDATAAPAIILLQGTTKGALDKTMDKKKLAAGKYFLSIVADGKTASIQFTVK